MSEPGKNIHDDPWSTCSSCRFWKTDDDVTGACHRYAPTLIDSTPRPWAVWPLTSHHDICGEFAAETDK